LATLRASIQVLGGMGTGLKKMNRSMTTVLNSFEALHRTSSNAINTSNILSALQLLSRVEDAVKAIERGIREANDAQNQMNNGLRNGQSAADGLADKVKNVIGKYLSVDRIKQGVGIVSDFLGSADALNTAETKQANVMGNNGAAQSEYETIRAKDSEVGNNSTFGNAAILVVEALMVGLAHAADLITVSTLFADGATKTFFTTLMKNPLFWIAIVVGILVALIYTWVESVGGIQIAWQIAMQAILTTWDVVRIGIFTGVNRILDLWDRLRFGFAVSNVAIQNMMGDMRVNVLLILQNMVNGAIDIINGFITTLNEIPGVSIEAVQGVTFGKEAQIENAANKQARMAELNNFRNEIVKNAADRDADLNKMKSDAVSAFVERQAAIAAAQAENATKKEKKNPWDKIMNNIGNSGAGKEIAVETAGTNRETAANTAKMAQSMETSEEDLKYLRDVAERDVINRFTTAEVKVDMTNNNRVNSELDLDGIIDRFGEKLVETLDAVAEGV